MANLLDSLTQDQSGDDDTPLPKRVYIYGDGQPDQGGTPYQPQIINAPLAQAVAPEQPNELMQGIAALKDYVVNGQFSPGTKVGNRLFGTGGEERYQTWPERMVREGTSAPGDVLASTTPSTSESLIAPAQSVAALAGGGALTETPGVGSLGSGPLRTGTKAISTEPAPVFYSALEHAVDNSSQKSASPEQWLGTLKNTPGVKQEELQWSGVGDWLKGQKGKVSKEDVQAYLDANKTEIKDVTKGDTGGWTQDDSARLDELEQNRDNLTDAEEHEFQQLVDRENGASAPGDRPDITKYSQYQLPGGENYREHLLTLPQKDVPKPKYNTTQWEVKQRAPGYWDIRDPSLPDRTGAPGMGRSDGRSIGQAIPAKTREEAIENTLKSMGEDLKNYGTSEQPTYRSSHWDEPNVLAHVRTNDRDVGGKKSLHIEEIQSDWHQQGRKQGYKGQQIEGRSVADIDKDMDANIAHPDFDTNPEIGAWHRELQRERNQAQDKRDLAVPDAPFKTTWPELALKRMIRYAAENGYDRVSWTPGEAQAARYDLSKQIDNIKWSPEGGRLEAFKDGRSVMSKADVKAEDLPALIGKEAADKIVNKPTKITDLGKAKLHDLSGVDLKVGGEGMREFYDKMLPKMAEKIGKSHGVKVKQHEIPLGDIAGADASMAKAGPNGLYLPVHYFDLPQSLKDHAIGKGFPLYMRGIPFPLTPVDHDPFKKEK